MPKKKTIKEMEAAIELGDEYKLISDEYVNAKSKLKILHESCGDVFQMSWDSFQQGQRCPGCSLKKRGLNLTLPFETIKTKIDSVKNYKLLSDEYIGAKSKLKILHESCGDVFQMTWDNFNRGRRCPGCSHKKMGLDQTLPFETIKTKIDSVKNYKLLSDEYINSYTKLEILHESCGDVFQMTWANFSQGQRCPKCWIKNNRGENHGRWNHNLTDEERENIRNCPENREWIKAVLDRDNDTCQKCGTTKNLEAHHIFPWALFPKLRFEVENGIVLCEGCHKYYHSIYRNGSECNLETLADRLFLNNRYPSDRQDRFIENHQHLNHENINS